MYNIIYQKWGWFGFSFPNLYPIHFLLWLIVLACSSSTILKRRGWPLLQLNWRRCLAFFFIQGYVGRRFVIYSLYSIEECSLQTFSLYDFYHKGTFVFGLKSFLIYWDYHVTFTLSPLTWYITLNVCQTLYNFHEKIRLDPGQWSYLFMLISFCKYFFVN